MLGRSEVADMDEFANARARVVLEEIRLTQEAAAQARLVFEG